MGREREERATEAGVLAEVVQQAVEAKRARPQHFSVLLVRLLQPKDKPSASVMRASAAKAAAEARAAAEAALPPRPAAGGLGSAEEEEPEEELDEEERRLLAERETQRRAEQSREAEMRSEVVDFF